jgi:uncharacterized RmlC-like cupin family protein
MTIQEDSSPIHPATFEASAEESATNLPEVITVRPEAETLTRQRLPYFVGISEATAGATGISMNLVIIPPGGSAEPHFHRNYETAIYLVKGRVETRYGKGLKQSVINEPGDFIFIPPGVPHQPFNLSETEPAHAIVARNDPNEQENVVLYDAMTEM